VITHAQIDFYRTFGFVVLPELIAAETVEALSEEFDRVLPEAFGSQWPEREDDGISGHYLPAMGPRTPVGCELAERLLDVGEALLGAPALPWACRRSSCSTKPPYTTTSASRRRA
jgi:hypothetical protein